MKVGDLVRFVNQAHYRYHLLSQTPGLVTDIDYSLSHARPFNQRHLGAKVIVVFGEITTACTEHSLEVIK